MKDDKEESGMDIEILILVLLIFLIAISGALFGFFAPVISFVTAHKDIFNGSLKSVFDFIIVISFPVSVILLIGIIVSIERLKSIRKKEHALYNAPEAAHTEAAGTSTTAGVTTAPALVPKSGAKGSPEITNRWKKIVVLTDSTNQNDWKQAIIDADSILDDMLTDMNYYGNDLGSKLRSATKADFKTLEFAGEAHGIRNRIAHDGSNFLMSQYEAKRVINLYRQVFEEFHYI